MAEIDNVEKRESLLHHMQELFVSIRLLIVIVFVGAGIGYVFSEPVVNWLMGPFHTVMGVDAKPIVLHPFEKMWVHLRVAMYFGLLIVAPGIYWALYKFAKPALLRLERRRLNVMMVVVIVVFWGGVAFGQHFSVPILLKALMSFKSANEAPMLALSSYVNMTLGVILATALIFELPVVMFFLASLGWIKASQWAASRRFAIVGNAAVSAVLSPPDVLSMLVMMLPIQVLYEVGILVARMAEWKKHEAR